MSETRIEGAERERGSGLRLSICNGSWNHWVRVGDGEIERCRSRQFHPRFHAMDYQTI